MVKETVELRRQLVKMTAVEDEENNCLCKMMKMTAYEDDRDDCS